MIEIVRDTLDAETRLARHDWAEVTGQTIEPKPTYIRDTDTGAQYAAIAGAIGWPTTSDPGCIIVAGIRQDKIVETLRFAEHRSVYALLDAAVQARINYGHGKYGGILPDWIADPSRYMAVVVELSVALERTVGPGQGFYVREPADWADPHPLPLYMWQLRDALGNKRVVIRQPELIGRLQAIQPDMIGKGKVADYPAAGMLAALIHTISTERQWEQPIDHGKPINKE